jgi:hypothetical protein
MGGPCCRHAPPISIPSSFAPLPVEALSHVTQSVHTMATAPTGSATSNQYVAQLQGTVTAFGIAYGDLSVRSNDSGSGKIASN